MTVTALLATAGAARAQDLGFPDVLKLLNPPAESPALAGRNSTAGVAGRQGYTADPFAPSPPLIIGPGIGATVNYTSESAGNPIGGLRQGSAYAGQVFVGLDFDLNTLVGLEGGSVHFAVTQRHGRNLAADDIGSMTSVQEIYGTQNLHLALLTYEQKFLDGKLDVEAGRTVANVSFLASPLYCMFQTNSFCGNPTMIFVDSNFTYFPAVSWGGHARYNFTDTLYIHAGAYEVNPADELPTDHGFNFSTSTATGAVMPFEIGYGTTFANDYLPRHYAVGGWYDASAYADPFLDAAGTPALTSGLPPAMHADRGGMWARFDQMVYREGPDTPRGLTVFGVFMQNLAGRVKENQFFGLGLLKLGTFAGRDADTIGFVIDDQEFSGLFTEAIANARGFGGVPKRMIMMDLNYGLQVNPWVRVTPDLQYIINPDQSNEPFLPFNIPNAFVIGGKLSVDISSFTSYAIAH